MDYRVGPQRHGDVRLRRARARRCGASSPAAARATCSGPWRRARAGSASPRRSTPRAELDRLLKSFASASARCPSPTPARPAARRRRAQKASHVKSNPVEPSGLTYRDAGVDIDAGDALVERIKGHVKRTMRPEVMGGLGGFAGLCALPAGYREPLLVSCTDGVGKHDSDQ